MGRKRGKNAWIAAVLIVVSLVNGVPASAVSETETEYIVKYKESAAWLMEDDSVPFDVVTEAEMNRLRSAGLLEWYEPDGVMTLLDETASPWYEDDKWDLALIQADAAFEQNYTGRGLRIGILDSGINPHADLTGNLLPGHNYLEDADADNTIDAYGHGTLVAGLISGAGENGAIGVATGAEIVPLKVTDGKAVMVSTVCRAIYGGINDYNCDILNLSLGITSEFESLKEAVDYAEEQGVLIVSAVGNNGTRSLYYPAAYDSVVGVGAVDQDGSVYYHSNRNDSVFLTAPGVNVKTTGHLGGYVTASGTSFAVPYVTAAAAVMRSCDPSLTPRQIMQILSETATDQGAEGYDDYYGYGILNIAGCVEALTGESDPTPEPSPDPAPEPTPDPEPSGEPQPQPSSKPSPSPEPEPKPSPEPETEWKTGFKDCPGDGGCVMAAYEDLDCVAWYHDGVHFALENGIMNGVSDQMFAPNSSTSRAMIVTMLWRMEGEPVVNDTTRFADVPSDTWYTEAVRWAASERIVDGYSAERFAPNDNVSREQLATILWRYAKYKGTDKIPASKINLGIYLDAEHISRWAYDGMQWAVNAGLITGVGNDKLSPETDASRAQVATMLMRYGKIIK